MSLIFKDVFISGRQTIQNRKFGGAQPPLMEYTKLQFAKSVVILPLLGSLSSFSPMAFLGGLDQKSIPGGAVAVKSEETLLESVAERTAAERAAKIDTYFRERGMPLAGHGAAMVAAAEKHDLDWRLLPAIAVRESSGGKQMCGNNPFGWGSCKIKFQSIDHGIETLAKNLGGDNPATARYYSGTTREKLYYYNGTVLPTYVDEVLDIMDRIDDVSVDGVALATNAS